MLALTQVGAVEGEEERARSSQEENFSGNSSRTATARTTTLLFHLPSFFVSFVPSGRLGSISTAPPWPPSAVPVHMDKPRHYGLTPFDGAATVGGIPNSRVIMASQRVCGTTGSPMAPPSLAAS